MHLKTQLDWKWMGGKTNDANNKHKKIGMAIFISDKIDSKVNSINRDKEGCWIMVKGLIVQEDNH